MPAKRFETKIRCQSTSSFTLQSHRLNLLTCLAFAFFLPSTLKASPLLLSLSKTHRAHILEDEPIEQVLVVENKVWVLGQNYIWRLEPANNSLHRMGRPLETKSKWVYKAPYLWLFSDSKLYRIHKDSLTILRFSGPADGAESYDLHTSNGGLYWIKSNGIFSYDPTRQLIVKIHKHNLEAKPSSVIYESKGQRLWTSDGYRITSFDYRSKTKEAILRRQKMKVWSLNTFDEDILAVSDRIVMRLSPKDGLIQNLPVRTSSPLRNVEVLENRHFYQSSNNFFQISDFKSKESLRFRIDDDKPCEKASSSFKILACLRSGHLSLYSLESLNSPSR